MARPAVPKPAPQAAKPAADHAAAEPQCDMQEELPQVEIVPTAEVREKTEKAASYLAEIMRAMGFETIEVTPAYYSENVCLRLGGAQLGVVIGRRGETLDALQYLTSLVANRGDGDYIRVNIDSGNYREKREKTLTALARKLALQAVRTGKSTTLEPMNPYERRVIHGAVSQIRGAVSTSIGADPNRRVVISIADPAKRTGEAVQERSGRGRTGDRRDGKPAAPRTPRAPLRPNTNTAESVAAAKIAPPPTVTRIDEGDPQHTVTFVASRPRPEAPPPPPAFAPAPPSAPAF
ncbi:MAG: RNA-binding cell elongation regulator Jag/EloR, partial [Angelakisella sp.]